MMVILSRFLVVSAVLFSLLPLYWIVTIAIKSPLDMFTMPPGLFFTPVWENFGRAWTLGGFERSMINSLVVCALTNLVALGAAIPAAYALSYNNLPGGKIFLVILLFFYLLPEFLFVIPLYHIFQYVGLFDTRLGLVIAYQIFSLPFAIWLLRGFFTEIPPAIAEAAELDGCSRPGILIRIYVPLNLPAIMAIVILNSIRMWNELTSSLALTFRNAQTLPLSVASFRGYGQMDWGAMAASSLISAAPMIILALCAQRYIVRGLTLGAVK